MNGHGYGWLKKQRVCVHLKMWREKKNRRVEGEEASEATETV